MTHSKALDRGRTKAVKSSGCGGSLVLMSDQKQSAGPVRSSYACRGCGNLLSIQGEIVVSDSPSSAARLFVSKPLTTSDLDDMTG